MPKHARRADRGWFEPGAAEGSRDAYWRLACDVLRQAARDASGLDSCGELRRLDAALWLLSDGPIWFDCLGLGELEPARFLAARGQEQARRVRFLEVAKV